MNTVKYSDLKTDKQRVQFLKDRLATNPRWILKGLYTVYLRQTETEKVTGATIEHNNVGFSSADSDILTSFAQQMVRRGFTIIKLKEYSDLETFFSPKQVDILTARLPKYARQLMKISKNQI
jgi:hypothetical protein